MDGLFTGNPEFVARNFQSVDARQVAFVDYQLILLQVSGATGAMPAAAINPVTQPRDFGFTGNVIGLGGTPSPIADGVANPLLAHADVAAMFIRQNAELNKG